MDIWQLFFQYLKPERIQVSTYIYFMDSLFTSRGILVSWASTQNTADHGTKAVTINFLILLEAIGPRPRISWVEFPSWLEREHFYFMF